MKTLTDAQARTLIELNYKQHWFDEDGLTFEVRPEDAFPGRNNIDNAHRRNLRSLVRAGLAKDLIYRFRSYGLEFNVDELRGAYRDWYNKRGWKQYDPNPILT